MSYWEYVEGVCAVLWLLPYVLISAVLAVLIGRELVRNPRCRNWRWIKYNCPLIVFWPAVLVCVQFGWLDHAD